MSEYRPIGQQQSPQFQPISYPRDAESQVVLSSKNVSVPFDEFYTHLTKRDLSGIMPHSHDQKIILGSELYLEISRANEATEAPQFKGRVVFLLLGVVLGIGYMMLFRSYGEAYYWPIMGLALFGGYGVGVFSREVYEHIIRPWKQEFGRRMAER